MIFPWQFTVATGIFSLIAATAYIKHKHNSLEAKVNRRTVSHSIREQARNRGNLQIVPDVLLQHMDDPRLLHESCAMLIPKYSISDLSAEHFTKLLRYNMKCFARYPQAWIFRLILPGKRHTFASLYIDGLEFAEGELVCGLYRVVKRSSTGVELSIEAPPSYGSIGGLLIVRLEATAKGDVVLITETLQWTTEGEKKDLPLSKPVPKFLHEIASAHLLISGADFLGVLRDL